MGKKQKKDRGTPRSASAASPDRKAGRPSELVTGELGRQIRAAHAATAWGKVIALWQQGVGTKGNSSGDIGDPEVALLVADAFDHHGMALFRKGNSGAVSHFKVAAGLVPSQSRFLYHLTLAHHRNGQWLQALDGYRAVMRQEPTHLRAAYHLCLACLQSGLECQPGGALDKALVRLQEQANSDLPSRAVRRLQAWRAYVRSGSTAELEALYTGEQSPEAAIVLEAALVALSAGKAEGARRRLKELPNSADDALSACVAAVQTILSARAGHHRQAVSLAGQLNKAKPPQDGPHRDLVGAVRQRALWEAGLVAWWHGERADAASLWESALALDPREPALRLNTALALDASGSVRAGEQWQELAKNWERSAQRKETADAPSHRLSAGLAYQRAGEAELRRGNWREARRLLERALSLAPGHAEILYDLAHLAVLTGDHGWLRTKVPALREQFRNDALRLATIGHLCQDAGLDEEAEPIWLRLLEVDPTHECAGDHLATIYEDLGERAWAAGRSDEATAFFERGLELVPGARRLHIWLGGIDLLQGNRQRAEAAFAEGRAGDDDAELIAYADVEVGKHMLRAGLRQDAEAAFRRGLQSDRSADTYLGMGLAYLAAHDLEPAVKHFKEAGRRSDFNTAVVLTALDALYVHEAYGVALELVLEALDAWPDDHNLWTFRTMAEFALNGPQMDKSVAQRARLLALQEGNRSAVQALDQILRSI